MRSAFLAMVSVLSVLAYGKAALADARAVLDPVRIVTSLEAITKAAANPPSEKPLRLFAPQGRDMAAYDAGLEGFVLPQDKSSLFVHASMGSRLLDLAQDNLITVRLPLSTHVKTTQTVHVREARSLIDHALGLRTHPMRIVRRPHGVIRIAYAGPKSRIKKI